VLKLAAVTDHDAAAPSSAATAADTTADTDSTNWLGIIGILLGVTGLVTGLLAYRRASHTSAT
jgi:hypothetical protein